MIMGMRLHGLPRVGSHTHTHIYIYIYIYREREMYVSTHMCKYIYIYIYIMINVYDTRLGLGVHAPIVCPCMLLSPLCPLMLGVTWTLFTNQCPRTVTNKQPKHYTHAFTNRSRTNNRNLTRMHSRIVHEQPFTNRAIFRALLSFVGGSMACCGQFTNRE